MPERVSTIVVLGGDAAAASVAAGMANSLRETGIRTVLVDDPSDYAGIASTLPATVAYHERMALNEASLVRATGATYKLGYEYVGWGTASNRFLVTTGSHGVTIRLVPFHQYVLRDRLRGGSATLDDYSLAAKLIEAGRFLPPGRDSNPVTAGYQYGLHLDRQRYAAAMAGVARGFGVDVRATSAVGADCNAETGFVESVALADGSRVNGDLFIDCSGERAMLIDETLGVGLRDWSDVLPCDRAISVESTGAFDLQPVTRIIAKQHGWMRRVQFVDKSHFEYFFSSACSSEQDVRRNVASDIPGAGDIVSSRRITPGCREAPWTRNVIAVGRAAANLESLESSSMTQAHRATMRLLTLLPDRDCKPAIAAEYNRRCNAELRMTRDLMAACYARSGRDDAGFWARVQKLEVPQATSERLRLFESHGRIRHRDNEAAELDRLVALLTGLGCWPEAYDPLVDAVPDPILDAKLGEVQEQIRAALQRAPTHDEYLRKILKARQ